MSAARANVYAILFLVPIFILYVPPYLILWQEQFALDNLKAAVKLYKTLLLFSPVVLVGVLVFGVILHELLHGLTWAAFCKNGLKSITYGIHWKLLTPYCHCKEMLPLRPYMLGGAMPGLVMGLLPALLGLAFGNIILLLLGLFFSFAAGGDLLILWMLRKYKPEDRVQDHPDKIGCFVFVKES